uniref:Uncharacterized protein n=1 Tax=Triatoma infestans TaxID=30076 RepID=A0A170UET9_TRIIF
MNVLAIVYENWKTKYVRITLQILIGNFLRIFEVV